MRFETTVWYKGDEYEVSAIAYHDSDDSGRSWIAVEDIEADADFLESAGEEYIAELIADRYSVPCDGPEYD